MMHQDLGPLLERMELHFQPLIELTTGQVAGFESLARYRDAKGRACSFGEVIGEIEADPALILRFTCTVIRLLNENLPVIFDSDPHLYASVNLPPALLGSGCLRGPIGETCLPNYLDRLVIEITERQALTTEGRRALDEVVALGVRVAIDDFGTGESGLKQLLDCPLHVIKIDQSQIAPLPINPSAERLLRGVVALASALRVHTVAEGVETSGQAFYVRAAGVDNGQGYYWSRALPADELITFITARNGHKPAPVLAV